VKTLSSEIQRQKSKNVLLVESKVLTQMEKNTLFSYILWQTKESKAKKRYRNVTEKSVTDFSSFIFFVGVFN
jgi:hypothetical protein